MLDWTDRHCRYFHRLLSKEALLYTEMVTTGAIIHGNSARFLKFNSEEHPVALQLGGSNPSDLATCARFAESEGYDEVNLNVGCPSDRVQNGRFGACLMAEPALVGECVAAMQAVVTIPVTVKSRIGIDHQDSYDDLVHFVDIVSKAGCGVFIVHARKAWLKGLSPKENREIPPLQYERVFQLKQDFPHLEIIINGGITTMAQSLELLNFVDGVMVGREAYQNPFMLAQVDARIFQKNDAPVAREAVVKQLLTYIQAELKHDDMRLNSITRHILGLYHGEYGARLWRRYLSENVFKSDGCYEEVLMRALEQTKIKK
jgi:tRNA-dihydrouridine synthase A